MPRGTRVAHGIVALCALLAFACAWQGPPKSDLEHQPATPAYRSFVAITRAC